MSRRQVYKNSLPSYTRNSTFVYCLYRREHRRSFLEVLCRHFLQFKFYAALSPHAGLAINNSGIYTLFFLRLRRELRIKSLTEIASKLRGTNGAAHIPGSVEYLMGERIVPKKEN